MIHCNIKAKSCGPAVCFIHLTTMLSANSRAFTISATYEDNLRIFYLGFKRFMLRRYPNSSSMKQKKSSPSDVEFRGVIGPSGCYNSFLFLQKCPLQFLPPCRSRYHLISWFTIIHFISHQVQKWPSQGRMVCSDVCNYLVLLLGSQHQQASTNINQWQCADVIVNQKCILA